MKLGWQPAGAHLHPRPQGEGKGAPAGSIRSLPGSSGLVESLELSPKLALRRASRGSTGEAVAARLPASPACKYCLHSHLVALTGLLFGSVLGQEQRTPVQGAMEGDPNSEEGQVVTSAAGWKQLPRQPNYPLAEAKEVAFTCARASSPSALPPFSWEVSKHQESWPPH